MMTTSTKLTILGVCLAVVAGLMFGMYLLGSYNGKVEIKKQSTVNNEAVMEVAKLSTLEQPGSHEYTHTNKLSEEGNVFTQVLNTAQNYLFEKTVTVRGRFMAVYGCSLDSTWSYVDPELNDSVVYITLPVPQLLYYETPDSSMSITEENGALVLERNEFTQKVKKEWSDEGRTIAANDAEKIQKAKESANKSFTKIFGGILGKKVVVRFEKDFKGYKKLSPQDM